MKRFEIKPASWPQHFNHCPPGIIAHTDCEYLQFYLKTVDDETFTLDGVKAIISSHDKDAKCYIACKLEEIGED